MKSPAWSSSVMVSERARSLARRSGSPSGRAHFAIRKKCALRRGSSAFRLNRPKNARIFSVTFSEQVIAAMRRVLVVDDEENIRLVLKTLLKRHGYEVE